MKAVISPRVVTLTLTEAEARAIFGMAGNVSGLHTTTGSIISELYNTLKETCLFTFQDAQGFDGELKAL